MKRFLAPAGHIIFWWEIFSYFFSKKFNLKNLDLGYKTILVNSGTSALYHLFSILKNISPKDEVIIPAYTCPTVAAAIIKAGLKPVLCDISLEDFSLLDKEIQDKLSANTLAIVQVELFGILPDNSKLREIADHNDIYFVGDAAQSFGNYLNNNNLLSSQKYDFLIFSTGRGKPLNILNGGGLIISKKEILKIDFSESKIQDLSKVERIKNFLDIFLFKIFFNPRFYNIPKSLPFLKLGDTIFTLDIHLKKFNVRLSNLTNAVLKRYPEIFENRIEHKQHYAKIISKNITNFFPVRIGDRNELIRFPILFRKGETRDLIKQKLNEEGIGATGLYPCPLNIQPGMEIYNLEPCPNATLIAKQILTLPIHEYILPKDYDKISHIFCMYLG